MDRLKTLDAEFLYLEDSVAHMHIAGACVFPNPAPNYDDLVGLLAGKMHKIPRYRQRVRSVPLELGRPVWVDDPHFDVGYHVRHTAIPAPGDDATFTRLMGRLMSQPLDRKRPLWEAWLVEGLEDDRWALVFKVHHAMVDGIAGVQLLTVLLDVVPDTKWVEPEPWTPQPEPTGAAKIVDAWSGLAEDAMATTRRLAGVVRHPERAVAVTRATVGGLTRYLGNLGFTSTSVTEGAIGPHRSWAHATASLDDVKTVGQAFGGTVNDVILAAVTSSFRELMLTHGEDVSTATIRSMVPVSTRSDDGRGVPDNRVSAMLFDLPVTVADPIERFMTVRDGMAALKESNMIEAGEVITTIGDLAPPMLMGALSRAGVRLMQRNPQRSIDTITTNVPGPQFPLYCLGSEMLEYRPFVPIMHGMRLNTAILSYNGKMFFGVTGDYNTGDDADVLADGAVEAIDELYRLAVRSS
ncbi:MAG: wax ester/triacylglycerol synthase family O-acyltransferase [Aquihabitans sp.]